MNMEMMRDMMRLDAMFREATRNIREVVTVVEADDLAEMKKALKEYGYNYVVNGKAYKNANDIKPDFKQYLPVKCNEDGSYTAKIVTYEKIA